RPGRRRRARESGDAGASRGCRTGVRRQASALLERACARRGPAPPGALRALRRGARVRFAGDGRIALAAAVAAAVVGADQATKAVVAHSMALHQSIDLLPFFALTYLRNSGAAFGVLAAAPATVRLP